MISSDSEEEFLEQKIDQIKLYEKLTNLENRFEEMTKEKWKQANSNQTEIH